MTMNYDEIAHLRNQHPAWGLLRSNNVALVLSFLGRVFVDGNSSGISASELADQLDDELFALNNRFGEDTFPKSATSYLDDWASPEHGWLRKYYPSGVDEAHFDKDMLLHPKNYRYFTRAILGTQPLDFFFVLTFAFQFVLIIFT